MGKRYISKIFSILILFFSHCFSLTLTLQFDESFARYIEKYSIAVFHNEILLKHICPLNKAKTFPKIENISEGEVSICIRYAPKQEYFRDIKYHLQNLTYYRFDPDLQEISYIFKFNIKQDTTLSLYFIQFQHQKTEVVLASWKQVSKNSFLDQINPLRQTKEHYD